MIKSRHKEADRMLAEINDLVLSLYTEDLLTGVRLSELTYATTSLRKIVARFYPHILQMIIHDAVEKTVTFTFTSPTDSEEYLEYRLQEHEGGVSLEAKTCV